MEFALRFTLVVFATWAAVAAVSGALSAAIWTRWSARGAGSRPAGRATAIAALRLVPVVLATAVALVVAAPAFHRYEPRYVEDISWLVIALGGAGALMIAATIARVCVAIVRSVRLERAWQAAGERVALPGSPAPATVVDLAFPLLALAGVVRPRIFVARRVLEMCPGDQLSAMLDHERTHRRRRDNLTRLFMRGTVDVLACTRLAASMNAAWDAASEQAADDGATDRLALAGGLVRIARLASQHPATLLASSLVRSGDVENRVRRLVAFPGETAGGQPAFGIRWYAAASGALLATAAADDHVLRAAHAVIELAVGGLR